MPSGNQSLHQSEPNRHIFSSMFCRGWKDSDERGSGKTMSDRTLTCRDCGNEFVFTAGEQDFYTSRGFSEPQRCPQCRNARKQQRNNNSGGYGSDSGYSSSSYDNDGGYRSDRGGYNNAPRQMHDAVCSECGKQTQVPFEPTAGKPVYCRECFQARRSSSPRYSNY